MAETIWALITSEDPPGQGTTLEAGERTGPELESAPRPPSTLLGLLPGHLPICLALTPQPSLAAGFGLLRGLDQFST
jgi:hypothetical protein